MLITKVHRAIRLDKIICVAKQNVIVIISIDKIKEKKINRIDDYY